MRNLGLASIKHKKGNNKSTNKIVKGQFSSLSAMTKGELYEDNKSIVKDYLKKVLALYH
jgi:hypothetical protein